MSKLRPHRKGHHTPNAGDIAHMGRVAELGCIVCSNIGHGFRPAEVHHLKVNPLSGLHLGMGQRASHKHTIPLCTAHHRGDMGTGYHGGPHEFGRKFGTELELYRQVCELLGLDPDQK